jgi:hypothetical protein
MVITEGKDQAAIQASKISDGGSILGKLYVYKNRKPAGWVVIFKFVFGSLTSFL